eukprot:10042854-Alexandrium_andersonii.AAC.1
MVKALYGAGACRPVVHIDDVAERDNGGGPQVPRRERERQSQGTWTPRVALRQGGRGDRRGKDGTLKG